MWVCYSLVLDHSMLNFNPKGVTDFESWLAPKMGSNSYSLTYDFLSNVVASDRSINNTAGPHFDLGTAYHDRLVTARWSI
jgi:hypothetical protein